MLHLWGETCDGQAMRFKRLGYAVCLGHSDFAEEESFNEWTAKVMCLRYRCFEVAWCKRGAAWVDRVRWFRVAVKDGWGFQKSSGNSRF